MEDCFFCKIAKGETDKKFEKETENLVIFKDINPQAPIHLLIVPRKHVKDLGTLENQTWIEIKEVAVTIAKAKALDGFRLVLNDGEAAAISHLHIHLLGEVTSDRAV